MITRVRRCPYLANPVTPVILIQNTMLSIRDRSLGNIWFYIAGFAINVYL
jgi:hypothetical protein